jgi:hypothetical protein
VKDVALLMMLKKKVGPVVVVVVAAAVDASFYAFYYHMRRPCSMVNDSIYNSIYSHYHSFCLIEKKVSHDKE